jgi:hypothetical protein
VLARGKEDKMQNTNIPGVYIGGAECALCPRQTVNVRERGKPEWKTFGAEYNRVFDTIYQGRGITVCYSHLKQIGKEESGKQC